MQKQLRIFGLIWAIIFAAIALYPLISTGQIRLWAAYISLFFICSALLYPRLYQLTSIILVSSMVKFNGNLLYLQRVSIKTNAMTHTILYAKLAYNTQIDN